MWLNLILLLHALLSIPFAAWLLIDPAGLAAWLTGGAVLSPVGAIYARLYGGCLILIAVLTWTARVSPSSPARRLVVVAMLIQQILGALISLTFPFPFAKWFSLVFFVVFAIAYAYILIFRPQEI